MTALPEEWLPNPMDVVWCRFPYHQKPGVPGVTPHPGLVFATGQSAGGHLVVQLAYGTSNLKSDTRPDDFRIMNYRSMGYAGLFQATRFDLDKIKWLLWDSDWFISPDPEKYPTPVIGRLLSDSVERLKRKLKARQSKGLTVPVCET